MKALRRTLVCCLIPVALVVVLAGPAAADFDGDNVWNDEVSIGSGNSGNVVGMWQQMLHMTCDNPANFSQDGLFGTNTKNATKSYQTHYGLSPDGVVGPNTWTKARSQTIYTGSPGNYTFYPGLANSFPMLKTSTTWYWLDDPGSAYYNTSYSTRSFPQSVFQSCCC
jgi:peptidoglycan hydrolase-like protein with peptidoglycan-binding domain